MSTNKGIALLQVLLITGVISILALFFVSSAQKQVAIAHMSNDRVEAQLAMKSAESELLLALLTEFRELDVSSSSKVKQLWNFHNVEFSMESEVIAQIQDQAGLISLQSLNQDLLRKIFRENGLNQNVVPNLVDGLLDWQDADKLQRLNGAESGDYIVGPRNGAITLKNEIYNIKGVPPEVWHALESSFTLYRRSSFNPMSATPQILKGLLGEDKTTEYIKLRNTSTISPASFGMMSGLSEEEGQIFSPGDVMQITLRVKRGEVNLKRKVMVNLMSHAEKENSPVEFLEIQ
ncbi:general secretion pathway protein GspK [Paraglaciecola sp.]|uniref:general secretion pathway protein GspK n=1 Tax=Paraglaciecola sp. TaxID=1920173 RepID=UPI003EF31B0D